MKIHFYIIALLLLVNSHVNAQFKYDPQKITSIRWTPVPASVEGLKEFKIDLNGNWQFNTSPLKDFYRESKFTGWNNIEVPGEWVMQGYTVKPGEYAGYVRSFNIPAAWKGKRIVLKCKAIYSECKIWINHQPAGQHLGGMTSFEIDITSLIQNGENNIAIGVRSESLADTLSSASKYAVHPLGGITRPICIIALPVINVASFHVSTTFDSTYTNATLKTELKIANETSQQQQASLKLTLRDASGKAIPVKEEPGFKLSLSPASISQQNLDIKVENPKKWDPEHPNLYFLECAIIVNGKEISKVVRRFGFRQIEVRYNQVFVNNQPIKLKGVCRHETSPDRGRSLIGNQWAADVKIFKEANVNYIRTSHYPPNEKLLEACDELGMFVEEEAPFCWAAKGPVTDNNYFEGILQPTLEMVERDKSHPCIIHWSLANESNDFIELFKTSADLVKTADPSRPRIFSQWGEDSDGGYLELGNHHYPGPTGPAKYRDSRRPVSFDEYCHLNAYNRFELMTDPGVRDYWGDLLLDMWENMYHAKGVLGGALWAGIDDSFFLPDSSVVGYGTWGPIDGWRRPKPEYWHMKKIFTPVKITIKECQPNDPVTIELENRYFFSNLNECRIVWKNGNQSGTLNTDIKIGAKGMVKLPVTYSSLGKMTIDVFRDSDVPVDQYVFDQSKPVIIEKNGNAESFIWSRDADKQIAVSSQLKVIISKDSLMISDSAGRSIINGWPVLMLVPLNSSGDIQMTKESHEYELYSPTASNRKIESIEIKKENSFVTILLKESYHEAIGKITMNIYADGRIMLAYDYKMLTDANYRQWGMSFSLPSIFSILTWKRHGLWNVYPSDHIGRNVGTAKLFYDHALCGLAGPSVKPSWPYNMDQTKYGSNDFRSTKRNILEASLQTGNGDEIKIISDGEQNLRCWFLDNKIHLLVSEHDNPGGEGFLRDHAMKFDQPLKQGEKIGGVINLQILNTK